MVNSDSYFEFDFGVDLAGLFKRFTGIDISGLLSKIGGGDVKKRRVNVDPTPEAPNSGDEIYNAELVTLGVNLDGVLNALTVGVDALKSLLNGVTMGLATIKDPLTRQALGGGQGHRACTAPSRATTSPARSPRASSRSTSAARARAPRWTGPPTSTSTVAAASATS